MSVTDAAKRLATKLLIENDLPATRTVFIEHYEDGAREAPDDPATFDLLTFSSDEPETEVSAGLWMVTLGEPSWQHLDRATVEALVGGRVD
jgi:hypothetical protein